ncbi:MAG: hypothetical protein EPO13_02190 [Actinomycetota bacterium]|nr:MAG: hypothetical protein EPO13_02190 [Actinomycetota bacterium]
MNGEVVDDSVLAHLLSNRAAGVAAVVLVLALLLLAMALGEARSRRRGLRWAVTGLALLGTAGVVFLIGMRFVTVAG